MDTLSLILDDMRLQGTFTYTHLQTPWALALEGPGMAISHIVTGGSAWLLVDGETPQALAKGDMVILPRGVAHRLQDRPNTQAPMHNVMPELLTHATIKHVKAGGGGSETTTTLTGVFRFDEDMAAPLVAALPTIMQIHGHDATLAPWQTVGLEFLAIEMATQRPAHQAVINRLFDVMFIEAVRGYLASLPQHSSNWLTALRDKALSTVLSEMYSRPEHDWTVQELASVACLSRSAFAERFSQAMGVPPLTYLTRHRMRLAARYLSTSGHSVARIAELVGYSSEAAFSPAFKREYGLTPSAWRERKERQPPNTPPAADHPTADR